MSKKQRVAIIGTGISGIAAMKSAQEEKFDFVVFEKQDDIGGFWRYKSDLSFPSVYASTHIDSKRDHNSFGTVPQGPNEPQVLNNAEVIDYLRRNLKECGLEPHIRWKHEVTWITDAQQDNPNTGLKRWRIDFTDDEGKAGSEVFDGVMICSGRHSRPRIPRFEGMDTFKGFQIHSSRYKSPEAHGLQGKRIVVVGVGNSGLDIVFENAPLSEHTWVVARRGVWLIEFRGNPSKMLPNDKVLGALQLKLPWELTTRQAEENIFPNQKVINGSGLQPDHHFLSAHPSGTGYARGTREERGANRKRIKTDCPTIHDYIRQGKITGKRGIKRITPDSIIFSDGEEVKVDAIVYATGFKQAIEFLDPAIVDMRYDRNDSEVVDKLYQYVFPMTKGCGSLGFIAFCQSITFLCAELQSRLAARVITGAVKLPSIPDQVKEMAQFEKSIKAQFNSSPRHAVQGGTRMEYYDQLATMIGCYPSVWKLLLNRPTAIWHAYFTTWSALTYRLVGPGATKEAERQIEEQFFSTRDTVGHGRKFRNPSGWPTLDYWKQVWQMWWAIKWLELKGFDGSKLPTPKYLASPADKEYAAQDSTVQEASEVVKGSRKEQIAKQVTITAKL